MKFKNYIKSEINQREVDPSHDTFDRIQARLENQSEVSSHNSYLKWSIIAAVCIGILVGVSFFMTENKTNKSINNSNLTAVEKVNSTTVDEIKEVIEKESIEIVDVKGVLPDNNSQKKEIIKAKPIVEALEPVTENIIIEAELNEKQIVNNLDTAKVKTNKKINYVDPNMLLYSIENKEALKENNNQKSRVVIIDFNKTNK